MALKAGRVGVNPRGVDKEGMPIVDYTVIKEAVRSAISNLAIASKSGDFLTITDALGGNVTRSLLKITPVQSGSGTPSSENIRPISGHSSINVTRTGKNLVNWKFKPFANGLEIVLGEGAYTISAAATLASGNWYIKGTKKSGSVCTKQELSVTNFSDASDPGLYYGFATGQSLNFTVPENDVTIKIGKLNSDDSIYAMLETGSTVSTYTAYDGTTYTPYDDTVYGGYLNLSTGLLVITDGYIASYDDEELPGEWISDRDEYVAGTTPTTGAQVVYKLAEPVMVQTDPITIALTKDINHLLTEPGISIEISYLAIDTNAGTVNRSLNRSAMSLDQIEFHDEVLKKEVKEEIKEEVPVEEPVTVKKSTKKTTK